MGYILQMKDGPKEAGQYAVFTLFENQLATIPFSLVQRDFPLKKFFVDHPNTGGKRNDGRVMDCICRIDAVLKDKRDHEFALLTPIIPTKQWYDITLDKPDIFMRRIEKWAVENKRALKIGKLKWEKSYDNERNALDKTNECIDVLLNKAQMKYDELVAASNIILADNSSKVTINEPESLDGCVYDLRNTQNHAIKVTYDQTGESRRVSVGTIAKMFKDNRITNAKLAVQGTLVRINSI